MIARKTQRDSISNIERQQQRHREIARKHREIARKHREIERESKKVRNIERMLEKY